MNINTNSWHYKVMSAYQYGRYLRDTSRYNREILDWQIENNLSAWVDLNYDQFKKFSLETGKYLPLDFCSYWRNVLLWPGIAILLWVALIGFAIFTAYTISWIGFGVVGALGLFGITLALLAAVIGATTALLKRKVKTVVSDGFFSNVQRSLEDNTFCTVVSYDKEESK